LAHRHQSAFKESLEELENFAIEVILDRRRGFKAACLRSGLWVLSLLFRQIARLRLALFEGRWIKRRHLGCLVISVGNLTVGGTGKTPVTEHLARCLRDRGRQVAILSRGYKSEAAKITKAPLGRRLLGWLRGQRPAPPPPPRIVSDGRAVRLDSLRAGDEPFMLASNLPGVVVMVDKNRIKSGHYAIEHFGTDTLVLDDGMQYVKLFHHIDLVLVDRTAPFGNEHMLPRGTLREPHAHLRRASYIIITKCDGSDNTALITRLRQFNTVAEIIECNHHPVYLENAVTRQKKPLSLLQDRYVGSISGIAVPESFESGLERLGAEIAIRKRFTDHHRFTENEIYGFVEHCERRDVDMIVTTEKDFVRFPPLPYTDVPIYFLRVEIEILKGQDVWDRMIDRICAREKSPRWVATLRPTLTEAATT
jgi:tetraacyldisaccharide 4'-kinase